MPISSLSQTGRQPRAVFLLIFTQMWESFSFYGMRVLLVLYLINQLNYPEQDAFALYALYATLIELGAFVGGYCADRFLGLRTIILLGGGLITLGHLCLTFGNIPAFFFFGLGSIICGSTLFRSNLKALLGLLYTQADPGREAGFTFFYTGINLGGFIAALLCGYAAQVFGWHIGFSIAALGMFLGIAAFIAGLPLLQGVEEKAVDVRNASFLKGVFLALAACFCFGYLLSQYQLSQMIMVPFAVCLFAILMVKLAAKMPRREALSMLGALTVLMLYFTIEELMGSLIMVFCERQVDRVLFGWEIPSAMLSATNPLTIIVLGPFLSLILSRYPLSLSLRLALSYLLLAIAFAILYAGVLSEAPSAPDVIVSFALIALGELFLVPSILAFCSQAAPAQAKGLTMGLVALAFALASLFSGQISQNTIGEADMPALFLGIALCAAVVFFSLSGYYLSNLTSQLGWMYENEKRNTFFQERL